MKKFKYILALLIILFTSGCSLFKRDTMENINVITTIYSIEYVLDYLYGDNAIINSIYPDDTNIDNYTFTEKQIKDNSKKDLFVYMGLTNDANQAIKFVNRNKNIKLIDATFGMEYKNDIDELWLNPSNLLMISQNIKNGLSEYINSTYLIKEINEKYENLKLELSELDADIKLTIENAEKKTIFTNDVALKYLEKYGLTVIVIDEKNDTYEKNLTLFNNYLANNKTNNIFIMENTEIPDKIDELINENKVNKLIFRNIKNINDTERNNEINYIDITKENLESLKKELY